jgi:transcriptional regulator with XRE-family HTH domain
MNISHKSRYLEFSHRLISSMKQAGLADTRSPSGISVKTLAETMGVSEQICRRYLRGDALPDYEKTVKIARFLSISPGWLLFGNEPDGLNINDQTICMKASLLHYLLERSHAFYMLQAPEQAHDFPSFVLALINDISAIDADPDTLKKIIDLAVSSISSFEERKMKHINCSASSL